MINNKHLASLFFFCLTSSFALMAAPATAPEKNNQEELEFQDNADFTGPLHDPDPYPMYSDEEEEFSIKGRRSFTLLAGLQVVLEEEEPDFYDDADFTGPMHDPDPDPMYSDEEEEFRVGHTKPGLNSPFSMKQLNILGHPFCNTALEPEADFRLASAAFVSRDPNCFTNFDWIITNDVIYALVKRMQGGESEFGFDAAYAFAIPVAKLDTEEPLEDIHMFKTCYNRKTGIKTWKLDGQRVLQMTQKGDSR